MSYRAQAWLYVLLGVGVFVAGLATLLNPKAERLYLGAIIVGPLIVYRGIRVLRLIQEHPELDRLPPSDIKATELYANNLLNGDPPKEVTCEECAQRYVYFPGTAAHSQTLKLGHERALEEADDALVKDCAVAPCPRCGRIQTNMFPMDRSRPPSGKVLLYLGALLVFGSAMVLCYGLSEAMSRNRPPDAPSLSPLWFADAGILLLGVGLLLASLVLHRRWNPNKKPLDKRLRLAGKVSLLYDSYLKWLETQEFRPAEPGGLPNLSPPA
jgi:hypothetical protein